MARSIRSTRTTRKDEGTAVRPVHDQPTPFLGLVLAPGIVLILTWLIHYSIMGWRWGSFTVEGSPGFLGLAVSLATTGAVGVGAAAWHFSYDRHQVWRYSLTVSATLVGLWLPALIYNGPNRYLSIFFVLTAWIVATVWSLPRLHVLRRDPRENGDGDGEGDLMRELGLEGYKSRGTPEIRYDEKGEPSRITVDVKHKLAGKRDKLQAAIGNIESLVGGPGGMSRVTEPPDGKSNHSIVTVMLKDPLKGRVPAAPPSHPGGSVSEYAHVGMYDDEEPVYVWVFGGINPVTGEKMPPTGYAFMGMTRSGKTVTENRLLLDGVITRRDGVILYLNKAKGSQDVQTIIAGVEAAILSDNRGDYRNAFDKVIEIGGYRQKQLARYGISAWSAEKCFDNPPTHTIDGRAEPMEPMPALIVHVGEADSILEEAADEAIWLASKGLSLGIIAGWSMQRWAATSMPTDLRFNIGCSFCFGVGDKYSADFALSDATLKAGADPAKWKNRHPGKFFVENIGIEEYRFPVSCKGMGDTDDDALYSNMRALAERYAPQMAKLDKGSVRSTRGWWEKTVRETDALRDALTPRTPTANPEPESPVPTTRQEAPVAVNIADYDPDSPPPFDADEPYDGEDAADMAIRNEVEQDIANMTHIDGVPIRGGLIAERDEDDPDGPSLHDLMDQVDPDADIPPPPPDGVVLDEGKPDAATPQDAQLEFDKALRAALLIPELRDPADPTGRSVIVRVGQLRDMYPFRSRGWFSDMMSAMADGGRECPPGIRLEKMPDPRGQGFYRITASNN
jgi:hypothetical protein